MILICALLLGYLPQTVVWADAGHITVLDTAEKSYEISSGSELLIYMNEIFRDAEEHELSYSLDQKTSSATYFTDTEKGKALHVCVGEAGKYTRTITATCEDEYSATFTIVVTVTDAGAEGLAVQYNYDETDQDRVTVRVTISSDALPIMYKDEATEKSVVLAALDVSVPYFDLEAYGLDNYYRFVTENGSGPYTSTTVVKRPTALHLYIYLLGIYYYGLTEDDVLNGDVPLFEKESDKNVYWMNGEVAYTVDNMAGLSITGSATSLYMTNFWGHDENLMYYRNHAYPLMSTAWGSTCDYILLSDGDTIDLAMFSNWSFYTYGAFCCFEQDDYKIDAGEELTVTTLSYTTSMDFESNFKTMTDLGRVVLYDEAWNEIAEADADGEGNYTLTIDEAGTYYLLGLDENAGISGSDSEACYAPAVAKVVVSVKGDLNGDGEFNSDDVSYLVSAIKGMVTLTESQKEMADLNEDGVINNLDAADLSMMLNEN